MLKNSKKFSWVLLVVLGILLILLFSSSFISHTIEKTYRGYQINKCKKIKEEKTCNESGKCIWLFGDDVGQPLGINCTYKKVIERRH